MKNFTKAFTTMLLLSTFLFAYSSISAQSTCATAVALTIDQNCGGSPGGGANSGDPTGNDDTEGNVCSTNYSDGDDYIFEYTAGSTDALELDLWATNTWTGLMVTEGCPIGGICIASSLSSAVDESLTTPALTMGVTYYIHISTYATPQSAGPFCLDAGLVAPPMPPTNDACANAIVIASGGAGGGNISLATDIEGLSPCSSGTATICEAGTGDGGIDWSPGVWYVYHSTGAEGITVDLSGSSFDTEVQIFEGSCGSMTCVGGDDDSGDGVDSKICWESTASFAPVDYYIYIDGHGGNVGDYVIQVNAAPLPVELISFQGEKMEAANKLTWITGSEANTKVHVIERSADGNRWEEIGKVEAQGFSSSEQSYQFMDEAPFANSFYRLKTVDFDGSAELSNVIRLERQRDGFSISRVFPVPAKDEITIEFNVDGNEEVNVVISDLIGRVVYRENLQAADGINNFQLEVAGFANGVYFLSLSNATEQLTQRIIKN